MRLCVKETNGSYREATSSEVLATASLILQSRIVGQQLKSPKQTVEFLKTHLGMLEHEVFCCLFLDNRHRVLSFDEMFRGTVNGTAVYPREIVKRGLQLNAAAVILAHNHPSGISEPSRPDTVLTERLRDALGLVDIRVLDHIVIGHGEYTSFSERGLI